MRLPWRHGLLETAGWLADDTLVAAGWCLAPVDGLEAWFEDGDRRMPLEARWIGYPRPDFGHRVHPAGRVIVLGLALPEAERRQNARIVLGAGGIRFATTVAALRRRMTDPAEAVRSRVAGTDARTRGEIVTFLAGTLDRAPDIAHAARTLVLLRDALRDPLPRRHLDRGEPNGVGLDHVLRIDDRHFYVKGWAYDPADRPAQLTVTSPEGARAELLPHVFRYPRPDVDAVYGDHGKLGFLAHVELDHPSIVGRGWLVSLVSHDGLSCEAPGPAVTVARSAVRDSILEDLDHPGSARLIERHTFPALNRLQELDGLDRAGHDVVSFGVPAASPDLSIVVPLYRRVDFLEHQLAHFVDDPDLARAEIIYVLDSPEQADELRATAALLHDLYRLPFRLVLHERNLGFAAANNTGAAVARGRLLLLLNSDVFPARPGWTTELTTFYDATPRIGALGPKLLFEDGTLQHAGLYFARAPGSEIWANLHYHKGFDRHLRAAAIARPVPAVTAACLLISRERYLAAGGLRGQYVCGDYEDSDLCLRLLQAGLENWYLPDVELYHLEGQSYAGRLRNRASRYNAWLHTRLWGDAIEEVMGRFG